MKSWQFIFLFSLFFSLIVTQFGPIGSASEVFEEQNDIQRKAFVMKGWLKFFTYTPSFYASSVPNKFEYNPSYLAQFSWGRKPGFTDKEKDEFGFFNIPDDTHFFFILTKKSLFAVNARRNDIAKTYKSLELEWIEPVVTGDLVQGYKGGLEDIGNFKEGFCFRIKSQTNVIWNVCADTMEQKTKWMAQITEVLRSVKSNYKSTGESVVLSQEIKLPFQINAGKTPIPEDGLPSWIAKNGSRIDGRWVILQDWSQCTQACGNGKQFLQRMCVPPQNGGHACEGEAIQVKECNTHPCPNIIQTETEAPANPTTIKMQKLSSRPLKYEICVVKEGDLDLGIENQGFAMMPKFPVRVILNNKTISIFTTPSYENVFKSWDLNYLNVKISPEEARSCFVLSDLRDSTKKATLCIMPTAVKENQSIEKARDEWFKDIFFFRDKCKDKNKFVEESAEISRKRVEVEVEAKEEKYDRIREKENEDSQKKMEQKVEQTTQVAMEAVEKETKFEQLALEEELMREREEEGKLNSVVDDEQTRQQCMEREIKKKQKMQALEKQNLEIAEKAGDIQKQAVLSIQSSRLRFKEKIDRMRRAAERKRKDARKQVTEIRTKMAGILMNDNKVGNVTFCNPKRPVAEKTTYCNAQFTNDPDKLRDCMTSSDDFCYVCCENEFGRNKLELRERCYKLCDDVSEGTDQTGGGFWTFVPTDAKILTK